MSSKHGLRLRLQQTKKVVAANKCSSSAGRFDGHGGAPEQYRRHHPMQHVQGYSRSHWTPTLGNYLLRIAPAAARATGIQTTINKYTCEDGRFDGHGDAPVSNRAHHPMERSRASLEATGRHHWASIMPNNMVGTWLRRFFSMFSLSKP